MEPSPLSDGDLDDVKGKGKRKRVLQWSRRLSATETGRGTACDPPHELASMEPSPLSDGDHCDAGAKGKPSRVLQWSRRLSATETGDSRCNVHHREWLQWSRRLSA